MCSITRSLTVHRAWLRPWHLLMVAAAASLLAVTAGCLRSAARVKRWQVECDYLQTTVKNSGTIDQQVLTQTEYQLEAAKAARQEVEAKVKSAEATRDEMAAKRDKAGAEVSAAKFR